MRVRDDQLDPARAPPGELPQDGGPDRLRLGRADLHAQPLHAPPLASDDIATSYPQPGPGRDGRLRL